MKIKDIMMQNHTSNVYEAARWINAAETDRICETYQTAWDNGESFSGAFGGFTVEKRESDNQEEADTCAKQLYNALVTTLKREWAKRLTHEQACEIIDALQAAHVTGTPTIAICEGVSLNRDEVRMLWKDAHPDEAIAENKMYIVVDGKTGNPVSTTGGLRRAVKYEEVPHDEKGLVFMRDIMTALGYKVDDDVAFFEGKPMRPEKRYALNDLLLITLDISTGKYDI